MSNFIAIVLGHAGVSSLDGDKAVPAVVILLLVAGLIALAVKLRSGRWPR